MLKYNLYLDESGDFKNQETRRNPSLVGGFLTLGEPIDQNFAATLFQSVKESNPLY